MFYWSYQHICNNATLNRFFSLHYLLPFIIAALSAMHLIALCRAVIYEYNLIKLYAGSSDHSLNYQQETIRVIRTSLGSSEIIRLTNLFYNINEFCLMI